MASWKEERDRLVAQTLAFVQQVAAAHPSAVRSGAAQSRQIESLLRPTTTTAPIPIVDASPLPIATSSVPSDHPAVPSMSEIGTSEIGTSQTRAFENGSPDAVPAVTQFLTPAMLPNHAMYSAVTARADITQRVAAFKARQGQISREREAYYETMQAKIRTTLGNVSSADRL